MSKKKMVLFWVLLLCVVFEILTTGNVQAKSYFSYSDVGLDYAYNADGTNDRALNGYAFIYIKSIKGNTIKYQKAKYAAIQGGGMTVKGYGKTKTAKFNSKTKYYLGNHDIWVKWCQYNAQIGAYTNISAHSKAFKSLKWLGKVKKKEFIKKCTKNFTYIQVKGKKVKKIISDTQTGN